nr:deoxyribodipyrimidine photo-lyase [Jeotgalibacillus soli]
MASLVWIRKDLRLHDHPALHYGIQAGEILPVYIHEENHHKWSIGSAQSWFLHYALQSFQKRIEDIGGKLLIKIGDPAKILPKLLKDYSINTILWNRSYEPTNIVMDNSLAEKLHNEGVTVKTFEGTLLLPITKIKKKDGNAFKVFTPFYKAHQKMDIPKPLATIKQMNSPVMMIEDSLAVNDLGLLPAIKWTDGLEKRWSPSELAAIRHFNAFERNRLKHYKNGRDFPSKVYHAEMSPYLALGLISVRSMYHYIVKNAEAAGEPFLRQLVWRDFAYSLMFHFPNTIEKPMNKKFENFKWNEDQEAFIKWRKGLTGYPIVDAGMRELWETGYMHNRVRMIAASFLTKHLLIRWQNGAEWFWDTLVDAGLANNSMGWQWVAGSGADASPYFRIFNPTLQSKKFDPNGDYIRKWVPELRTLSDDAIHAPHEQSSSMLEQAGIILNENYPAPIVEHKAARERALARYNEIK